MFGEKYYDQEEEDVDEIAQKGIDINLMKDVDGEADEVDQEAYERSLAGPLKKRTLFISMEKGTFYGLLPRFKRLSMARMDLKRNVARPKTNLPT